jgi:hypothetical protein
MRRIPSGLAALALIALVLAGCSGDGDRTTTDTTATGAPTGNAPDRTTPPATTAVGSAEPPSEPVAPTGCEPPTPREGEEAVTVELDEWGIQPTPPNVKDGQVAFAVTNQGTQRHELLLIAAPSPSGLPTRTDGSVDETRVPRRTVVGRVGPVAPGESCNATFKVPAASYVMVCNLVTNDGSHYAKGMVTVFSTG